MTTPYRIALSSALVKMPRIEAEKSHILRRRMGSGDLFKLGKSSGALVRHLLFS